MSTFTSGSFTPLPFLGGPHVQTLLGKALRPADRPELEALRLELSDGDFVDVMESPLCQRSDRPVVLVLHGLEGSALRRYMLVMYGALLRSGMAPIGLSFRGCSGEANRKARAYHSGDTGDLAEVAGWLRARYPGRRLGVVGFSLGGNVILKYLGETVNSPFAAAVAISVPFDLAAGSNELERGGAYWIYRNYFLRSLKRKVAAKRHVLGELVDVDRALATRTLRDFDDVVTAPVHGFEDADAYYRLSSSSGFVSRIRTHTLVIHSLDDPFLPQRAVPLAELEANPIVDTALPGRGGHVGFVASGNGRRRFWAEDEAAKYLKTMLAY